MPNPSLEILLAFSQILIPISFAFPPLIAYIQERSSDLIAMLLYFPLVQLWVTVIVIIFSELPSNEITAVITGITILLSTIILTWAYIKFGFILWLWDAQRANQQTEEQLLAEILDEIRNSNNND